jgi:hypothetical protein
MEQNIAKLAVALSVMKVLSFTTPHSLLQYSQNITSIIMKEVIFSAVFV